MRAAIVIFAFFVIPSVALAQPKPRLPPTATKVTEYRATQKLIFGEGDEIEVGPIQPASEMVESIRKGKRPSLIRIRQDFRPELTASALSVQ